MKNHRIKVYTPATGQTHRELVRTAGNGHGDILLTFAEGDGLQFTPKPGDAGAAVPTVESVTRCCQNKLPLLSTLWAGGAVLWGDVQAVAPTATATAKGTPPRQAVTLEEAARIVGRTSRTVQNWENGKVTRPEGYPGRGDPVELGAWVSRRKRQADTKRAVANIVRVGDVDRFSKRDKQYNEWQDGMKRRAAPLKQDDADED